MALYVGRRSQPGCLKRREQARFVGNLCARQLGNAAACSTSKAPKLFVEWHKTRSGCRYFSERFRGSYPSWTLSILSLLLWVRFAALAAILFT